ncbi:hypothetical protein ACFV6F_27690 [Kitasatospora phosalacinea]|uniref:hypothetical protein n=1 Tax=Kitasatospora phosalacinea TaxID=2065 RepID=UPI0036583D0C
MDELDDYGLACAIRTAHGRTADGSKKRLPDRCRLYLRDVTVRDGRAVHTLPSWRSSLTAASGRSLGRSREGLNLATPQPAVPIRACAVLVDSGGRVCVIRRHPFGRARHPLLGSSVADGE